MTDAINAKNVKNDQWSVKLLASKVENHEIIKPKYQRKRKWDELPKKETFPSEKNYILFLLDTYNSVHAITFGQSIGTNGLELSNVDGNNRINAILHYLKEPFCLFPEKLDDILLLIKNKVDDKTSFCKIEGIIKNMTYCEVLEFKYNKYFIEKGAGDIYNTHLKNIRDEMEPYFDTLASNMKINNKDRFDTDVKINVNIFEGYTIEEMADKFRAMNSFDTKMTEQEILASVLFNNNKFFIVDKILELNIITFIKKHYIEGSQNEVLPCYNYNDQTDSMNAYDFMIGFQNYSNSQCDLITKTEKEGLSIFFKIYKTIFKGGFEKTFTTENINQFIEYIIGATVILNKLKHTIFMEKLVANGKLFDGCNKKMYSLKKSHMFLIITTIIGYIKNNVLESDILSSIEKCLIYHFFVNEINDKEKKESYRLNDGIAYEAGGTFFDNKAKEYFKSPNNISCKITETTMKNVITLLTIENINEKRFETRSNGKDKNDKRRTRKIHEKFLIYYYYKNRVPIDFLKETFWIEHLFPFSSSWVDLIDIERLGNIFPIVDYLNSKRNNKHISEYKKFDKQNFIKFIESIVPSVSEYDEIISHENKKPHIHDSDKFNDFCKLNEEKLIDSFILTLFR